MTDQPSKPARRARVASVLRTEQQTAHMVRVVLGGPGLDGFPAGAFTDHYVKLLFPPPGAPYATPVTDPEALKQTLPRTLWPVTRTYTVRSWDEAAGELTLDVVVHGDAGLAGPWARAARPGDQVTFYGPGGAYAPDPDADWHLLVGDESALPAIGAALDALSAHAIARVLVEVEDATEEQPLRCGAGSELTWFHRAGGTPGQELVAAVRELGAPPGRVHAFVHGEAGFVREIRSFLRFERSVPREQLSISGYWRRGHDEDGFQSAKPEWNAAIEAEETVRASA